MKTKKDVEVLIKALKYNQDFKVQVEVAWVIGKIGDGRAVEPLIKGLKDEDGLVRGGAAEALGNIGDKRAMQPLKKTLNDKDWNVQKAAREALERIEKKTKNKVRLR